MAPFVACVALTVLAAVRGDSVAKPPSLRGTNGSTRGSMNGTASALMSGATASCMDTPGWTNGWNKCWSQGWRENFGCTPAGWTCEGYAKKGWCRHGSTVPYWKSHVWAFGHKLNYPEVNCCECGGGGGRQAPIDYTQYAANCYSGHGAEDIDSKDTAPVVDDATSCAARCDGYHECGCFVLSSTGSGQCMLRKNCRIDACDAGTGEFNVYIKTSRGCTPENGVCGFKGQMNLDVSCCSGQRCTSLEGSEEMRCEPEGPGSPAGYTAFQANCFSGHGGDDIDTAYTAPMGYDTLACAARCDINEYCTCFVLAVSEGQCFMRASCDIERCVAGRGDYVAYLK